jgi:uncharacterized membrane-anchored protein
MKTRALIMCGALLVLGALNFSIYSKERIKRNGETIFLDLVPRDPRSLMQGDYMTLNFALANDIREQLNRMPNDNTNVVREGEGEVRFASIVLDENRIATIARTDAQKTFKFRYRIRNGQVWLGTNAFFFNEGSEPRFALARYGEFRLDRDSGEAVLTGLRDKDLKAL